MVDTVTKSLELGSPQLFLKTALDYLFQLPL